MTVLETIEWAQDPIQICAGQPIIPASNFDSLSSSLASLVNKTQEDILAILKEQAKRYSACGANNADRYGVLRKRKGSGWQYLVDLLV